MTSPERFDLVIRWDSIGAIDEFDNPIPCALCGRPSDHETGPATFIVSTWHHVCDRCTQREAPPLYAHLQRSRAELNRGTIGPDTEAWIGAIDPDRGQATLRRNIHEWLRDEETDK